MTKARYAVFHPGKIGDALYSLPFTRFIYGCTGERLDFYTSDYCAPMKELVEYQPYISSFNIAPNYRIERMDMGCQPHSAQIDGYDHVWQLGFRRVPDRAIHQFIAHEQGVDAPLGVRYDCPTLSPIAGDYICIAPRGETTYGALFDELAQELPTVIIGGAGDYRGYGYDMTGADLLTTSSILKQSRGFVGLMSSQLVLANGFDIPRIAPHDGKSWDMRHVIRTKFNEYPINPRAEDILNILKDYT